MSIIAGQAAPASKKKFFQTPLKFGHGNAKLAGEITTFSLPAGYTCPNAKLCLSKAHRNNGTIKDGKDTEFRCYAASMEMRPSVRNARWHNLDLLRSCGGKRERMCRLILASLSPYASYVRIHDSGDFFSKAYLAAWISVAKRRPKTLFYCYSKALPWIVEKLRFIPSNLVVTASVGGTHDCLIEKHNLRYCIVIRDDASQKLADQLKLSIDHDDSLAMNPNVKAFALLIHGTQPVGSASSKKLSELRSQGWTGYGKDKQLFSLPVV